MSLRYPSDLNPSVVDYVVFTPEEYRTNQQYTGQASNFGSAPSSGQSIVLYMPNSTPAVGNENSWMSKGDEGPLGQLKRNLGASVAAGVMNAGTQDGTGISGMTENLKANLERAKADGIDAGRQAAVNAVGGISAELRQRFWTI